MDRSSTTARVAWLDSAGRVGLGFSPLTHSAVRRLQEWLFLNALAAAANAESSAALSQDSHDFVVRQNYTDILSAASAVEREAESLGADLEAVLSLIASRARSLLRASGAAIALAGKDAGTMICRASAGESAPPVGVSLHAGSGFSGECVRTGKLLRCDNAETDERVDHQSCRALGIRSMLAAPVSMEEEVVGLLEVFSADPALFAKVMATVLQRFAETILAAVSRRGRAAHDPSAVTPGHSKTFFPASGQYIVRLSAGRKGEDRRRLSSIRIMSAAFACLDFIFSCSS